MKPGKSTQVIPLLVFALAASLGAVADRPESPQAARAEEPAGPPRKAVVQLVVGPSKTWSGPLSSNQSVGASFVDGGLQLSSADVPPEIAKKLAVHGRTNLVLFVEPDGRVSSGRLLRGDRCLGEELLDIAKASWSFVPPKTNRKPVRTTVSVLVTLEEPESAPLKPGRDEDNPRD